MDHKQQLHQRILQQREKLEAVRAHDPAGHSEHARAVDAALAQLAMHLGGKWDDVDDVQAAQLTVWLESTRFLVHAPRGAVEGADVRSPPVLPEVKATP